MASATLVVEHPVGLSERKLLECYADELAKMKAVRIQDGSVILNPQYMKLKRFYFVELNGDPYLYCKVSEHEVEIYGLADKT